jgi:two-component system, NtrC family, sensor kinase
MASLFVIRGRDQGKRFELNRPMATVGRDSSNAIQLHDTEVSRRHAEIRQDDSHHQLIDLVSSNGTFVNNQRIERQALKNGDRVQIGRTLMIYTSPDETLATEARNVDIVGRGNAAAESRIISTIGQEEGSRLLSGVEGSESPWLARARSNLQVMYRTALAVSHTLDIDELLARIMELIFEWVEADRGCVMLLDPESGELQPAVRRDRKARTEDAIAISRDSGLRHGPPRRRADQRCSRR